MTGHPAGPPMAECSLPQMFGNKMVQEPDLVLVAGAEGVLGGSLFYDLLRAEFNIRCLVRLEDEQKIDRKPGVEFFFCDPLSGDIPEAAFEGVKYVVNIASPLNSGSLPRDGAEQLERLNNILITRSRSKGILRYVVLSSISVTGEDGLKESWPGINWHLEFSVMNSGIPFSIFRSGILVGDSNVQALTDIASGGGFSLFGRRNGRLYATPVRLLTEAIARALKTEEATGKTYSVVLENPVGRRELLSFAESQQRARKGGLWESDVQVELASAAGSDKTHSVAELDLHPAEYDRRARAV